MRVAALVSHPIQYHAPLFRKLAERVDLTVFFAHRATPRDQAEVGYGIEFDWDIDLLSGYSHRFLNNVSRTPGLDSFWGCDTPEIGARLAEGGFRALLLAGWHLKTYLQGLYTAKRLGIRTLVRGDSHLGTRRSAGKKAVKHLIYPPFLRLFDRALYVGERSRAYWTAYRYPASRMFFSPHCVDAERFAAHATKPARQSLRKELGLLDTTTALLFAGAVVPRKRPLDVIAAASRLQAAGRDVAVIVAGAGPLEADMRAAAKAAQVQLRPLGFCNQSVMPAVYAAADILVLSSEIETWGLVANEAIACGRPVVLADAVGAADDLARDKTAGRVYPVGNISAFAAAIEDIMLSPPTLRGIAAKSRAYGAAIAVDGIEAALQSR